MQPLSGTSKKSWGGSVPKPKYRPRQIPPYHGQGESQDHQRFVPKAEQQLTSILVVVAGYENSDKDALHAVIERYLLKVATVTCRNVVLARNKRAQAIHLQNS
jgi:hypothetical protein